MRLDIEAGIDETEILRHVDVLLQRIQIGQKAGSR